MSISWICECNSNGISTTYINVRHIAIKGQSINGVASIAVHQGVMKPSTTDANWLDQQLKSELLPILKELQLVVITLSLDEFKETSTNSLKSKEYTQKQIHGAGDAYTISIESVIQRGASSLRHCAFVTFVIRQQTQNSSYKDLRIMAYHCTQLCGDGPKALVTMLLTKLQDAISFCQHKRAPAPSCDFVVREAPQPNNTDDRLDMMSAQLVDLALTKHKLSELEARVDDMTPAIAILKQFQDIIK